MQFPYLHLVSNLLAGFSFFGISYFFIRFLQVGKKKYQNLEGIIKLLKRNSFIIGNISVVFWFCGLGHIMEAFRYWMHDTTIIVLEHWMNAFFGVVLCINLQIALNQFKKTPDQS